MAAGEIKSVLTLDVDKFSDAIRKATDDLGKLDKRLQNSAAASAKFDSSIDLIGQHAESVADKFKLLDSSVGKTNEKLARVATSGFAAVSARANDARRSIGDLTSQMRGGSSATSVITTRSQQYAGALVKLSAELADVTRRQREFAKSQGDAGTAVATHFGSFSTKLRHFMMTVAAARFAVLDFYDVFLRVPMAMVAASGEIERTQMLMAGLSKQSDDLARKQEGMSNTKFVFGMAKTAPFEVKALSDAFVKFKSVGIDPTNGSLQTLVDSVARFGGTGEHLKRASIAIQQMVGKGVISMEELRQQLGEAVPDAIQAMAAGTGMSMAELVKQISKGTVEAKSALDRMFGILKSENEGAALRMMETWVGQLEKLKTNWMLFSNEVGTSSGLFDEMKAQLTDLNKWFESGEAKEAAKYLSEMFVSVIRDAVSAFKAIRENWGAIELAGKALLAIWGGSKILGLLKGVESGYKSLAQRATDLMVKEKARSVSSIAEARAELTVKLSADNAKAQSAQRAAYAEVAASRIKHTRLMAEAAQHWAAYDAAEKVATTRRLANGKFANKVEIANQKSLMVAYEERANAAEIMASRIRRAEASLIASTRAANAQVVAAAAASAKGIEKVGTVTKATTAVVRGLGVAMGLLGGPIGLVTLALTASIATWMNWGRAAEEAAKKARDAIKSVKAGVATLDDALEIQARITLLKAQKGEKAAEISALPQRNALDAATTSTMMENKRLRLAEELKKIEAELTTAQANIGKAYAQGHEAVIESNIRVVNQQVDRAIKSQKAAANKLIDAEIQSLEKQHKEGKIKFEIYEKKKNDYKIERAKRGSEIEIAAYKAQLEVGDKKIAEIEAGRSQYKKGGQEHLSYERQMDALRTQLLAAEDYAKNTANNLGTNSVLLNGKGAGSGGDSKDARSVYARKLDDLRTSGEMLVAQLLSGDTEKAQKVLAEFDKGGDFEKVGPRNSASAKKMVDAQKNFDALTDYLGAIKGVTEKIDAAKLKIVETKAELAGSNPVAEKFGESIKQLIGDLPKLEGKINPAALPKIKAHLDEMLKQADDVQAELDAIGQQSAAKDALEKAETTFAGIFEKAEGGSSALAKMRLEFEKLLAKTGDPAARESILKALQFVGNSETLEENKIFMGSVAAANDMRQQIAKIDIEMLGDRRAIAQAQYDLEVVSSKARVDLRKAEGKSNAEGYALELAALAELNKKLYDKMLFDMRSPLEKMADEWNNVYDQIKNAEVGWANGFVDNLQTTLNGGKADWRAYAYSVISEIDKIILKKMVAEPLTNMIGNVGTAIAGAFGSDAKKSGAEGDWFASLKSGFSSLWDSIAGVTNANKGNTASVAQSTVALGKSIWQTLMGIPAESASAKSVMTMGMAADAAAQALMQIAASSGGGGSSGIWGTVASIAGAAVGGGWGAESWSTAAGSLGTVAFSEQSMQLAGQVSGFANGGIMTEFGSVPLRAYANGGIASSPQMAMFGEGSMPEAYVPLPDGRSIPVTMQGGGGNNQVVNINIAVSKEGGETSSSSGDQAGAWRKMADRIKSVVQEELVVQQRPGGALYK